MAMSFRSNQSIPDFSPPSFASGASGGNYGAAAGVVDIADALGALAATRTPVDRIYSAAMQNATAEKVAAIGAEASVLGTGLQAYGQTRSAKLQAEAAEKAAEKAAAAQKNSGFMSAFGGIAGAGLKLLTGGIG